MILLSLVVYFLICSQCTSEYQCSSCCKLKSSKLLVVSVTEMLGNIMYKMINIRQSFLEHMKTVDEIWPRSLLRDIYAQKQLTNVKIYWTRKWIFQLGVYYSEDAQCCRTSGPTKYLYYLRAPQNGNRHFYLVSSFPGLKIYLKVLSQYKTLH